MTTGQVGFSEALARAEAAIRASAPGFSTLTAGQKRTAVLRRAVRDAGSEPVGPSFPSPADEPRVIDALEAQLRNLQQAAEVAAPYRQVPIDSAAPELDISNDSRLLATEGDVPRQDPVPQRPVPRQPDRPAPRRESRPLTPAIHDEEEQVMGQAAFRDPAPDLAMRGRAVALQQELHELGFTPVIEGHIPLGEAATAVIRLTNRLNAVVDPEREARIAPQEFSYASDAAALPPASPAPTQPPAAETSAPPPGVDPRHAAYIATLQERVRAAGGRPEFTELVTSENVFRAIQTLENQLERLRAVERARRELGESTMPVDVMDPRELEIMALQQAIRDYGDVPVVTGEVRPDNYSTAILTLNRQLKEIVSRPDDFNGSGVNTDPFSTDARSIGGPNEDRSFATPSLPRGFNEQGNRNVDSTDNLALSSLPDVTGNEPSTDLSPPQDFDAPGFDSYLNNPTGFMTVVEAYREIEPLFASGDLAPLLLDLLTLDGFDEWSVEEQTLHFLTEVSNKAGLPGIGFSHWTTPEEQLDTLLRRFRGWKPSDDVLRIKEPETIGDIWPDVLRIGADFLDWSGDQLIPDSVAENLPDYFRVPVQAALNVTAPINLAMILAGGVGVANLGREFVGELVGGSLGQIAEDQGWPVPAQIVLEVVGGILGSSIGPELADAGARSLARIARELTGELLETPGDSVKFARLILDGEVDEALSAAKKNLVDDTGDVAGAAKFNEFKGQIARAAKREGLTEKQHLQKELAIGVVVEMIEQYDRPERGSSISTETREPFQFGLVIDDRYAGFLRTRITEGVGLYENQPELALNGLDRFLRGSEPSEEQYNALEAAFGHDFVLSISNAAQDGLLLANESDARP